MPHAALPYVAVAAAACSWGTWALVLHHAEGIAPMPATLETTVVMAVMTLVSWLTARFDRVDRPAPTTAKMGIAWLGISDGLNVVLYFAAVRLSITIAVLVHYLTPVLVAVASPVALRERLTLRTAFAVAVSLLGLGLMLARSPDPNSAGAMWRCAILAAASAVFYASNVIVNKLVAEPFSPSEVMFWHGVVATPFLAALVPRAAWHALSVHAVAFLGLVAVGPGALAGIGFVWGLRRMPAAHASTLTLLEPLVAVTLGALVFEETLTARLFVGGLLILTGSLLVVTQADPGPRGQDPTAKGGGGGRGRRRRRTSSAATSA